MKRCHLLLAGAGLAATLARGASDPPLPSLPPDLRDRPNLCAPAFAPAFDGSLAPNVTPGLWSGQSPLKEIRVPPQDLIVRWPRPVTITAQAVSWDSAEVRGLWFGLEYWDASRQSFVRLYEARDNHDAVTVRRFPAVTTTQVRFTIFAHVLRYDSIVMRQFALFGTPSHAP